MKETKYKGIRICHEILNRCKTSLHIVSNLDAQGLTQSTCWSLASTFFCISELCPDGSELDDQGECVFCERGFYKNSTADKFGLCVPCTAPYDYTDIPGAPGSAFCIIRKFSSIVIVKFSCLYC